MIRLVISCSYQIGRVDCHIMADLHQRTNATFEKKSSRLFRDRTRDLKYTFRSLGHGKGTKNQKYLHSQVAKYVIHKIKITTILIFPIRWKKKYRDKNYFIGTQLHIYLLFFYSITYTFVYSARIREANSNFDITTLRTAQVLPKVTNTIILYYAQYVTYNIHSI